MAQPSNIKNYQGLRSSGVTDGRLRSLPQINLLETLELLKPIQEETAWGITHPMGKKNQYLEPEVWACQALKEVMAGPHKSSSRQQKKGKLLNSLKKANRPHDKTWQMQYRKGNYRPGLLRETHLKQSTEKVAPEMYQPHFCKCKTIHS